MLAIYSYMHVYAWLIAKNVESTYKWKHKKLNVANYVASLLMHGFALTLSKQSIRNVHSHSMR